ncbi:MAG TPA: ThuA domain-containing protein [Vicinamibacterales bacterium]|nr:ThuA domain-containing protein [Vicinamibacterales bacterium]
MSYWKLATGDWKLNATAGLLTLALLMTIAVTAWAQPPRRKVLAFFTTGGETDHYLFAQDAMRRLGTNAATRGYSFAATSDWDALSDAGLKDVGLVIWLNDQPHTAAQRDAFRRYMDGGGAWLGFHISGFSSNAWPWYRNDFLGGGGFVASNWPSLPGRVNVDDPGHPAVKNMPATFVAPINEWYSWNPSPRLNPDIKVLLTLDKSNFPMGVKNMLNGGDIPVAWTNTKYRMVYLNYGHGDRIYTSPILTTMIDNSLAWLLGAKE